MYNNDTGVPRITSPHITLYHYSQVGPKIFCITLFHLVYLPQIALSYFMKIQRLIALFHIATLFSGTESSVMRGSPVLTVAGMLCQSGEH